MRDLKVLLVDDETEFVSTLAERLRMRSIIADATHTGEDALRMMENETYDVVVLDVMMPGIGGLETLKRIKSLRPGLAVILLTGMGKTKEAMAGMRHGAFDFLTKPVQLDDLMVKIRAAAEQPHGETH
jgi:DNA-binding response OmpR family regulator